MKKDKVYNLQFTPANGFAPLKLRESDAGKQIVNKKAGNICLR